MPFSAIEFLHPHRQGWWSTHQRDLVSVSGPRVQLYLYTMATMVTGEETPAFTQ